MTSQIIYNRANIYFSSSETKCSCEGRKGCDNFNKLSLNIPIIKQICGFNVNSSISIEKITQTQTNKYIYKFEITSKKLKINKLNYYKFFFYEKKYVKLSIKNTNKFIMIIKEILPKLNFNKFTGLFDFDIDKNQKLINFSNSKTNNILGFDVLGSEYIHSGECCICYDKTLIKTSCEHFLCVECWSKMKNISECPYCRHKKINISKKLN